MMCLWAQDDFYQGPAVEAATSLSEVYHEAPPRFPSRGVPWGTDIKSPPPHRIELVSYSLQSGWGPESGSSGKVPVAGTDDGSWWHGRSWDSPAWSMAYMATYPVWPSIGSTQPRGITQDLLALFTSDLTLTLPVSPYHTPHIPVQVRPVSSLSDPVLAPTEQGGLRLGPSYDLNHLRLGPSDDLNHFILSTMASYCLNHAII